MTTPPTQQDPFGGDTQHLIEQAQAGSGDALDELIRRHLPSLRVFVRAKSSQQLRWKESCTDIVQTVCREALGSLEGYRYMGEGSFRHWLFTLAMNKLRNRADYYGAAKRDVRREDAGGSDEIDDAQPLVAAFEGAFGPSQHAIAKEAIENFETSLDSLSEEYREVILLSRVAGMSHAEIAEQLGIKEGTVRVRLSRALSRLASAMVRNDAPERERDES